MSATTNVALAGASGSLGTPVLKALLDNNFSVTVLVRPESSASYPSGVKIAKVDYNDPTSFQSALKGQDAVISVVGYAAFQGQKALIDGAVAAGVKRIIPSEFGADPENALVRALPVFGDKVKIEQYVREKTAGTETSFTLICNNEFLDWDLDHGFGVDLKNKKMEIFDGGDVAHTATPLEFVAQGVVGVLKHPEETANRVVRLHGKTMTQNKLLRVIQKLTGEEGWNVQQAHTEEREKMAYQMLQNDPSNFMAWGMAMLQASVWGKKFGGDFSQHNDNALLGLQELTDADIEELVRARV